MAMAALGLGSDLGAIRKAGVKPLLLAAILFGWLVIGGALINRGVPALLGRYRVTSPTAQIGRSVVE